MKKRSLSPTFLLASIFFFSGFASLVYQVVWQRLLTVYYGVGTISIVLIVSVYMLGLGLGGLWGGRLAERVQAKITFYFLVELLLGCFGLASLFLLDLLGYYTAGSSYYISFICMFIFLCIPTVLMGITLPLLTKIFNTLILDFFKTVSFLYFINTLGATFGALCASYIFISFFGLDISIYGAAAINFILAILIFSLRYRVIEPREILPAPIQNKESLLGTVAYVMVFATGFLAIGYEIVWFRVVGVLVKNSPYAFSSVLAIYLLGIAVGSLAMNKYLRNNNTIGHKNLFYWLQFFISIYVIIVFIAYYYLTEYTYLNIFTKISFYNLIHPNYNIVFKSWKEWLLSLYSIGDVFFWPSIFVLIPTILMGASFPLISSLALTDSSKEGKTVGTVYFFNILGNVLGGVLTGFLLLPYLGTERTLLLFAFIGMLFILFVTQLAGQPFSLKQRLALVILGVSLSVWFFPGKGKLYEIMHFPPGKEFKSYIEEGIDGIIVTYQHQDRVTNYINGVGHGGRPGYVFYYLTIQAMTAAPRLHDALVIGYGTGSVAELILKSDGVKNVTIVELNQTLITNLKKMPFFARMLSDPRVTLIFDDGRRYLLQNNKKYDLILMDAVNSTTSYSNNLYSRQFFDLLRNHLIPGGIVLVWSDENMVIPRTLISAFQYVQMYGLKPYWSDFYLASTGPIKKNEERRRQLMAHFSPPEQGVLESLGRTCPYIGDQSHIKKMTQGYPINDDRRPVSEYYLGLKIKEKLWGRK